MRNKIFIIGIALGFLLEFYCFSAQVPPKPAPIPRASVSAKYSLSQEKIVVPAYKQVELKANNFTGPITWNVYVSANSNNQVHEVSTYVDSNGIDFCFVGYPSNYVVITSDGNISTTTYVTIQPPGDQPVSPVSPTTPPSPAPIIAPTPAPNPSPAPPDPAPDQGGFVYPPSEFTKSVAETAKPKISEIDAQAFKVLYEFCATKVFIDGLRPNPSLKTVSQVSTLVKNEEDALKTSTSIRSMKEAYPDLRNKVSEEFRKRVGSSDELTPEARAAYVGFLQELSAGFNTVLQSQSSRR